MKKKRVFGFGLGGLVLIGLAIIVIGSGFNGCTSFSITQEEAAMRLLVSARRHRNSFSESNPGKIHFASVGEGTDAIAFVHGSRELESLLAFPDGRGSQESGPFDIGRPTRIRVNRAENV